MIGKDLPKSNIRNNDFINVVFGRRATRFMNPDFKVDREEIVEYLLGDERVHPLGGEHAALQVPRHRLGRGQDGLATLSWTVS